jgi:penicillin-binding protein 2
MVDTPVKRSFRGLYVLMFAMFVLLVGQLYNMQIIQGPKYLDQAKDNRERELTNKASRGIIYDRNNTRLVVNNPSYSIAVTPADVPDINCATGEMEDALVFKQLADALNADAATLPANIAASVWVSDVIAVRPAELPAGGLVEIANRLSVPLQVNKNIILAAIQNVVASTPTSRNLFVIRRDVPVQAGNTLRGELKNLPGVRIYNELEYNFITRFDNCLKPVTVKSGLPYEAMVDIDTRTADLTGVNVTPEPVRVYTNGPYFAHLLGYVGRISREEYDADKAHYDPDDKVGKVGMEAALEELLRGQKGASQVVVNSEEKIVKELSSTDPITGNNVSLTIDSQLQISVTHALQKGLQQAKVSAGVAIVLRVDDGQVLSMVSLPSYDNNLFSSGISQADFDLLNTDPAKPMFDRAVGGVYPPGSTYKMITAAAALQEAVVTPETKIQCPGFIEVPYTWNERQRNRFRDWKAAGHGIINITEALMVSSDVFFYIVSGPRQEDRKVKKDDGTEEITWTRYYEPWKAKPIDFNGLGIDRLHRYADAFGLGKPTGIELPGEHPGLAPDPAWKVSTYPDNPWSMGDTLVTAIGQGYDLVTPLQLANATAAVANGGTLYRPRLVMNVTDPAGNVIQDFKPEVLGTLPVLPQNLGLVREGMRMVVGDRKGTAYNRFTLRSISVAGKTGTAEYGEPIAMKDGKEVRRSHAWFTAFAPFEDPEIAVVVLLEGGQESLEGSTYAVPVADEIMKAYFKVDK